MTTNTAIRVRKPASLNNLRLETSEAPAPGAGEVKVRIYAASINFRDGLVAGGFFPVKDGLIPLSDGAGEIIAVGEGVKEFAVGDAVVSTFHPKWLDGHMDRADLDNAPGGPSDGFACQETTRAASHFTRAPEGWSHAEAATLTCAGVTAWRAVITDGQTKPGDVVLILGTGGVSIFALQFAKAAGATVIATSSSPEKLERLTALGADHVINYREVEDWGNAVLALTEGRGAEHVIEVGGPHTIGQSLIAARTGGHVALIGAVGGFDIDTMPFAIVQAKRLRLQAVTVGSRRDQIEMVKGIDAANATGRANAIQPVIDSHFALDKLPEALRHLSSGNHVGKIVIDL